MAPPAIAGRRPVRWSRELIVEKISEWAECYGDAPCSADWNPSLARWRAQEWRIPRYHAGVWPSTNAVKRLFDGSFDAAVLAAGLEPHRPGPRRRPPHGARPPAPAREPAPPRGVQDELTLLAERLRVAEERAEELERRATAAERRADRAESRLDEARSRARRAAARARRLEASRARDLSEPAVHGFQGAEFAVGRRPIVAAGRGGIATGPSGPVGPAVLAGALRALADARHAGDRLEIDRALAELAWAAVHWRQQL